MSNQFVVQMGCCPDFVASCTTASSESPLHLGKAGKKDEARFICGTRFLFMLFLRDCGIKGTFISKKAL